MTICSCDIQLGPDLYDDCNQPADVMVLDRRGVQFAACWDHYRIEADRGEWELVEEVR